MARSQAVIKQSIINSVSGIPIISQLVVNKSQVAYNTNFIDIVARCINLFEQLIDAYKTEQDVKITKGAVSSESWLQDRVLRFQYSATTPQVLEILTDGSVDYAVIDPTLQIITRAAVNTTIVKTVTVKVAKNDPPEALSGGELAALQGYLTNTGDGTIAGKGTGLSVAGVRIVATSIDADLVYIKGTIYYIGQYNAVIQANVIAAIKLFLAEEIDFDGNLKVTDLEAYIKSVDGVDDVLIDDLAIRGNAAILANATYLIQNKTKLIPTYQLEAGYAIEDTTVGQTFADQLTFTSV